MKNIKTYKVFNESLRDKLKGKPDNELKESFIKLLNDCCDYTLQEQINYIEKEIIKEKSKHIDKINDDAIDRWLDNINFINRLSKEIDSNAKDLFIIEENEVYEFNDIDNMFSYLNIYDEFYQIKHRDLEYNIFEDYKIIRAMGEDVDTLIINKEYLIKKLRNEES